MKGKSLNKWLIGLLVLTATTVQAVEKRKGKGEIFPPNPGVYSTQTVYRSSSVCVGGEFFLAISSRATQISHINVSSAGPIGSVFSVCDARTSSDTTGSGGAQKIGGPYHADTTLENPIW